MRRDLVVVLAFGNCLYGFMCGLLLQDAAKMVSEGDYKSVTMILVFMLLIGYRFFRGNLIAYQMCSKEDEK